MSTDSKRWYTTVDPGGPIQSVDLDMSAKHGSMAVRSCQMGASSSTASPQEIERYIRIAGAIDFNASQEGPEVGKIAPSFRAITFGGTMVDIASLRGKKVWLIFYRYATCPLCNFHLKKIFDAAPAIKRAGLEVIIIFESAVPQFFQPGKAPFAPFPVIADPGKDLYRLYRTRKSIFGVLHPSVALSFLRAIFNGFKQGKIQGEFGQLPSHFLVDESGVIHTVHHGRRADDHLSWASVGVFAKISPQDLMRPRLS